MTAIHSVGTLYAIQDLFSDLEKRRISAEEFRLCFIKFGTSTAKDVYETATLLNWICTSSEGEIVATLIGKAAHAPGDRSVKLRSQLRSIIRDTRPPWASLLVNGRKEASLEFPIEIKQCFKEALLLEAIDEQIINWWDEQSICMREDSNLQRMQIGRRGERLTLQFELERTGTSPKWQAFETNFAGYDVLSVRDNRDHRHLKIEVKASTRRFKEAIINITEHEWITANTSLNDYIFHVWLIEESGSSKRETLFVVQSSEIVSHIPSNQGRGAWKQMAIPIGSITHPSHGLCLKS